MLLFSLNTGLEFPLIGEFALSSITCLLRCPPALVQACVNSLQEKCNSLFKQVSVSSLTSFQASPLVEQETFLKCNSDCTLQFQTMLMAFITVRVKSKFTDHTGKALYNQALPASQHRLLSLLLVVSASWHPEYLLTHKHKNMFDSWLNSGVIPTSKSM